MFCTSRASWSSWNSFLVRLDSQSILLTETQAVATAISSNQPIATTALPQPNPISGIEDEQGQPMVMTTSSIRHQINMGLDDLMCQLSTQLARIVKLMVENEVRNMHAQELRSIYSVDKSTTVPFWLRTIEGSLATISTVPFSVEAQSEVNPQKTTH